MILKEIKTKLKTINFIEIAMVIFTAIAALAALRSCQIADESKTAAENALKLSQKQFTQLNRPHLILNPQKFNNQTYYDIKTKGKILIIEMEFELKNNGNIVAKNITFPNDIVIKTKMKLGGIYKLTPIISLSPNDYIRFLIGMHIDFDNPDDMPKEIENLNSSEYKGIDIGCTVSYDSETDDTKKYALEIMYKLTKDQAMLVKQEERQFSK